MSNWVGFSDEELRRLKGETNPSPRDGRSQMNSRPSRGRPPANRGRTAPRDQPTQTQRTPQGLQSRHSEGSNALPQQARLSQPPPPPEPRSQKFAYVPVPPQGSTQQAAETKISPRVQSTEKSSKTEGTSTVECDEEQNKKEEQDEDMGMVLDEKDIIKQELHNVEKFQFQQKLIEEQNKKKRELLNTAIVERQKKAKQEATRLTRIQKDLAQLDHLLAIDVSIIRNNIEEASREYMEAQRRYERAEKEFIESKTDLHQKCELKDSMTEHLHMIIHQNEVRKARKLTELMEKLSMEEGSDSEGLGNIEELTKSAPSAYILGSLQSTAEQRMMMRRMRSTSETEATSDVSKSPTGSNVKRSASDSGPETPGSTPSGGSGGVTGWISSWILGSPTEDGKNKGDSDSNGGSTFKPVNKEAGSAEGSVVTKAPVGATTPEKSQALPDKSQALPEESQALPEKVQASTEKDPALPEKSQTLPEKSQTLPEKSETLTGKSQALIENVQTLPKEVETPQVASSAVVSAEATVGVGVTDVQSTNEQKAVEKIGEINILEKTDGPKSSDSPNESVLDGPKSPQEKIVHTEEKGPIQQTEIKVLPTDMNDNKVREQGTTESSGQR